MDLQISVFLLFILFTAGFLGLDTEVMNKTCSAGCKSGSVNSGKLKISGSCCGTDFCNAKDAPDPRKNIPNGNKCYYCDDQGCSNILSCSGTEDRCFTLTMIFRGLPTVRRGCVSKSLCDTPTSTTIQEFSCCEGNLCNGDKHVPQGVTQSSMYNRDKRVTQSFIQSFVHEAAKTVTQSSIHNGDTSVTQNFIQSFMHKSDTQSSIYNGAQSVTQSFLFLCSSLLSYFLLH